MLRKVYKILAQHNLRFYLESRKNDTAHSTPSVLFCSAFSLYLLSGGSKELLEYLVVYKNYDEICYELRWFRHKCTHINHGAWWVLAGYTNHADTQTQEL